MRDYLQQIRTALDVNLYYLSLSASLTVPDICGALDSGNGRATPDRYKDWFNKYVAHKYDSAWGMERYVEDMPEELRESILASVKPHQFFTAEDCYYFRCSMLHQGTSEHPKSTYDRIFFVEPGTTDNVFHLNTFDNTLNIDAPTFCNDMIDSAVSWLDNVENTERYRRNYDRFMKRYPEGLAPFMTGFPVIG